jgi:hypothetical protein
MADSIPLKPTNCPPSHRNGVRHASGTLSAIAPESCPPWPGARNTEGIVIFADPRIYDSRLSEQWRYSSARDLLDGSPEPTTSSLLRTVEPFVSENGTALSFKPDDLWQILLAEDSQQQDWARAVARSHATYPSYFESVLATTG